MGYTVKMSENENAILKIMHDTDSDTNPRIDWDNLGHMVCWHSRYNLGDEHNYGSEEDFVMDLARKALMNDETDYLQNLAKEKFKKIEIKYFENDSNFRDGWAIIDESGYVFLGDGFDSEDDAKNELDDFIEDFQDIDIYIEEHADIDDLRDLIFEHNVILPLYLYDHSGITMNTTGFSCSWDSGQVGWIYATHEEIIREFGSLDVNRAEKILKVEVEVFDQYIRGEVYGYVLEKKIKCGDCSNIEYEHVDSSWGFFGGIDYLEKELRLDLGEEYKELVDNLIWAE